jgi:sulfonate dioxygenase
MIPDLPWVTPIYKDETSVNAHSHQIWHSGVSYELQLPGLTVLRMDLLPKAELGGTEAGRDTIRASATGIYECDYRAISLVGDIYL